MRTLHTLPDFQFILVGRACGMLEGNDRVTADIDILLVPKNDPQAAHAAILALPGFNATQGALEFVEGKSRMSIDLLKCVALEKTYIDIAPHVHHNSDGVPLLNLDIAMAIKLHCFNMRQEDENGMLKTKSDLHDAIWAAEQMKKRRTIMSDEVAAQFKIGHYDLLEVRRALSQDEVALLMAVGVKKMLRPWDEETSDQKDFFLCFAEPGTCPLTGVIFDEEE